MTRKRVNLAYIVNDNVRRATYNKRKKGLMKKVSELSTLCGVEACAIISSPYNAQPVVWPSTAGAHRAISRFREISEMERRKKMVSQEAYLRDRIAKVQVELKRLRKENREKEMTQMMYRAMTQGPELDLDILNPSDLTDLGCIVEKTIKELDEKIKALQSQNLLAIPTPDNNNINSNNSTIFPGESSHQSFTISAVLSMNEVKEISKMLEAGMEGQNETRDKGKEIIIDNNDAIIDDYKWYMELLKPNAEEHYKAISQLKYLSLIGNNGSGMPSADAPPNPEPSHEDAGSSDFFLP